MNNKAVIYVRVSTDSQETDRQVSDLKRFADWLKLEIVKVFKEKLTGVNNISDRNEFNKMLSFIDTNQISNIVVTEISRLGRTTSEVSTFADNMIKKGVSIHAEQQKLSTLKPDGTQDDSAKTMLNMLASFAELERNMLVHRVKSGLRQSKSQGGANGGSFTAYGYKRQNKKLVIDNEESKVVTRIFNDYIGGLSTVQIADNLNAEAVPCKAAIVYKGRTYKGKGGIEKNANSYRWSYSTVTQTLKNRLYIGELTHRGETYNHPHLRIISNKLFNSVNSSMKDKSKPKQESRYLNPFKKLFYCECGSVMIPHYSELTGRGLYVCKSKSNKTGCDNSGVNFKQLLNVSEVILSRYSNLTVDLESIDINKEIASLNESIENTEKQLILLGNRREKLIDIYVNGDVPEPIYRKQIDNFKAKEDSFKNKLRNYYEMLESLQIEEAGVDIWTDNNVTRIKRNLKNTFTKVVLINTGTKKEIKVIYHPIMEGKKPITAEFKSRQTDLLIESNDYQIPDNNYNPVIRDELTVNFGELKMTVKKAK